MHCDLLLSHPCKQANKQTSKGAFHLLPIAADGLYLSASAYDVAVNSDYSGYVYGNSDTGSGDVNNGYGTSASMDASHNSNNTVTANAAVGGNYSVYGTCWNASDADVTHNTVTIVGSGSGGQYVYGGLNDYGGGTVSDNKVIINTTGEVGHTVSTAVQEMVPPQ
ncbi:hypothetical protein AGMMS49545_22500 [Betaproteobacteria bacterium]|nr:hypothetical protein AGMMS49545_22500 [Betaproteobacteria bacterium]GHU39941.1 hypothetical protein AGMMS50289_00640 [Betaproteobacteria bacterium]